MWPILPRPQKYQGVFQPNTFRVKGVSDNILYTSHASDTDGTPGQLIYKVE